MELHSYRAEAEAFIAELSREYYEHYAGLEDDFAIEPIYERHAGLFSREAVDELRELAERDGGSADDRRRLRTLLEFGVDGHLGLATKSIDAELARTEAGLTLDVDGESLGYRESAVVQANEPDRDRRARIEEARLQAVAESLNPLTRESLEQAHALARDLGWASYRTMFEELKGIDLEGLARQTAGFIEATEEAYGPILEPELQRTVGVGLDDLRRSDLPWFFRDREADGLFPADRLVESFQQTMAGLGIDVAAQANVTLDVEKRPKKSPRAFCAPVRVPEEVYLVVPPMGGRDDYVALFHEGGHTEHFAGVDPALPFEFRHLGDNSVTEGFAFLFDHLVEDPEWLRRRLGVDDDAGLAAHAVAHRLVFLRRYAAKLAYELELHEAVRPLEDMAPVYAARLSHAVRCPWPETTYLTDVDPGFYAANYLRAWSLETHLRATLRNRFGPAWFDEPRAGDFLRGLWRDGQRLDADELVAEVAGAELDFSAMLEDLGLNAG